MERKTILAESLFPRLQVDRGHAIYRQDLGRHMFGREGLQTDPAFRPVEMPMLEDLSVQFVHDQESGFEFIHVADCEGEEIWDETVLVQQSFRNLKYKLGEDLQLSILENGLTRVIAGGKYEASFLLLGNLWLELEAEYGTQMFAAVPSHNALFVGRQDDRDAILALQTMIRSIFFEEDRESLLSKAVYQRFDGEWKIIATAF